MASQLINPSVSRATGRAAGKEEGHDEALLLIDYMHDFTDDGALAAGSIAQDITANIALAVSRPGKEDLLVRASTQGAQGIVAEEAVTAVYQAVTIRKTRFFAFFDTGAARNAESLRKLKH
jgi:hypothetical protein